MAEKNFESVLYEKDNETGIVTVTINRPEIRNALTLRVLLELNWAVDAVDKDDTAKALIITGARPEGNNDPAKEAFSSGGYFNPAELESMDEETKAEIDLTDLAQKETLFKTVVAIQAGYRCDERTRDRGRAYDPFSMRGPDLCL